MRGPAMKIVGNPCEEPYADGDIVQPLGLWVDGAGRVGVVVDRGGIGRGAQYASARSVPLENLDSMDGANGWRQFVTWAMRST